MYQPSRNEQKYTKLPQSVQQLAVQRDNLIAQGACYDAIQKVNQKIIAAFLELFPQRDSRGEKSFQLHEQRVPSKHAKLHELRRQQAEQVRILKQQGVLKDVKNFRDETRKNEILDTSLIGYLQLLFVDDTQDYHVWEREYTQPGGISQFLLEQSEIIDIIPFNLGELSDKQLISLFSGLTSHTWQPVDEKNKSNNIQVYRNQAVYYIKELKEVLKTLKPIHIGTNELSYKIAQVTQGPGKGKIIEFRYNNFFNKEENHDKGVYFIIHDSRAVCKEKLGQDIQKIAIKKSQLQTLLAEKRFFFEQHQSQKDTKRWEQQKELLEKEVTKIYTGAYIQELQSRIQRIKSHKGYMSAYTYSISTHGMLNLIQKAIDELNSIGDRLSLYVGAKK